METAEKTTKLEELFELYKSGLINQNEYDLLKSELINTSHNLPQQMDKGDEVPPVDLKTIEIKDLPKAEVVGSVPGELTGEERNSVNKSIKITGGVIILVLIVTLFAVKFLQQRKVQEPTGQSYAALQKQRNESLDALAAGIDNFYEFNQAIEKHQLPLFGDIVTRMDSSLILKIDNGTSVILKNTIEDDGEEYFIALYSFRDYLEDINAYLIVADYNEDYAYILVSKSTGNKLSVCGIPVISDEKTRFACFKTGEMTFPELSIYRIDNPGKFTKEYNEEPSFVPMDITWINETELEVGMGKEVASGKFVKTGVANMKFSDKWNIVTR